MLQLKVCFITLLDLKVLVESSGRQQNVTKDFESKATFIDKIHRNI